MKDGLTFVDRLGNQTETRNSEFQPLSWTLLIYLLWVLSELSIVCSCTAFPQTLPTVRTTTTTATTYKHSCTLWQEHSNIIIIIIIIIVIVIVIIIIIIIIIVIVIVIVVVIIIISSSSITITITIIIIMTITTTIAITICGSRNSRPSWCCSEWENGVFSGLQ